MFLNNSFIDEGICNGTIGVITDLNKDEPSVQIAFCVESAIIHKWITRQTAYFYVAGQPASRTQFPLQNSFALTSHKTQSLTLPHTTADLSECFAPGQAYTTISRSKIWNDIQISGLSRDAFITDPEVIDEYKCLEQIASQSLSNYISNQ